MRKKGILGASILIGATALSGNAAEPEAPSLPYPPQVDILNLQKFHLSEEVMATLQINKETDCPAILDQYSWFYNPNSNHNMIPDLVFTPSFMDAASGKVEGRFYVDSFYLIEEAQIEITGDGKSTFTAQLKSLPVKDRGRILSERVEVYGDQAVRNFLALGKEVEGIGIRDKASGPDRVAMYDKETFLQTVDTTPANALPHQGALLSNIQIKKDENGTAVSITADYASITDTQTLVVSSLHSAVMASGHLHDFLDDHPNVVIVRNLAEYYQVIQVEQEEGSYKPIGIAETITMSAQLLNGKSR